MSRELYPFNRHLGKQVEVLVDSALDIDLLYTGSDETFVSGKMVAYIDKFIELEDAVYGSLEKPVDISLAKSSVVGIESDPGHTKIEHSRRILGPFGVHLGRKVLVVMDKTLDESLRYTGGDKTFINGKLLRYIDGFLELTEVSYADIQNKNITLDESSIILVQSEPESGKTLSESQIKKGSSGKAKS